jgi:DNA-binding phage protein
MRHSGQGFNRIRVKGRGADQYKQLELQLGKALSLFAQDAGMSAADLARDIGTSRQFTNMAFSRPGIQSFRTLLRFCEAMGLRASIVIERVEV